MKVCWLHRKLLHPSVDYCHLSQKQDHVFHGAADEKEETRRESTEALLLNDALLRGILAIGMLGHGLCVEEKEIEQVEEGKELSEVTLVELHVTKTESMRSSSTNEKSGGVMTEAVVKAEQHEEDEAKIEEKPLLMEEEGRTTLADLFAGEPFTVHDAGGERCGHGKSSAGYSRVMGCKEELQQKTKKSPPASATSNIHGVMRRMLWKKIHPEQLNSRHSREPPLTAASRVGSRREPIDDEM